MCRHAALRCFAPAVPLWSGGKCSELSPLGVDRPLDCATRRRVTPRARMTASSARRSAGDSRSGCSGLGRFIGASSSRRPESRLPDAKSHRRDVNGTIRKNVSLARKTFRMFCFYCRGNLKLLIPEQSASADRQGAKVLEAADLTAVRTFLLKGRRYFCPRLCDYVIRHTFVLHNII